MYGKIVNHDLHWIAGNSVNAEITYKVDGVAQDLTDYEVTMVIRNVEGETGKCMDSFVDTYTSTNNDFIISDPLSGKITFNLGADITKALNPNNELKAQYVYSLDISKAQSDLVVAIVRTLLRGKLYVHSEVNL